MPKVRGKGRLGKLWNYGRDYLGNGREDTLGDPGQGLTPGAGMLRVSGGT